MKLWKVLALSTSLAIGCPLAQAEESPAPAPMKGRMMHGMSDVSDAEWTEHHKKMAELHDAMAATMKELKALPQQCDKGADTTKCLDQLNQRMNLMVKWMEQMEECQQACLGAKKGMCKTMMKDKVDLQAKPAP